MEHTVTEKAAPVLGKWGYSAINRRGRKCLLYHAGRKGHGVGTAFYGGQHLTEAAEASRNDFCATTGALTVVTY